MKNQDSQLQQCVLGCGCFWCYEALFQQVKGVKNIVSGYSSPKEEDDQFYNLKSIENRKGDFAEVILITFDPSIVSFQRIVEVFFSMHDPTKIPQNNPSRKYRSILLYKNQDQLVSIQKIKKEWELKMEKEIKTEIKKWRKFLAAGEKHQNYFQKNKGNDYCNTKICPLLEKYRLFNE